MSIKQRSWERNPPKQNTTERKTIKFSGKLTLWFNLHAAREMIFLNCIVNSRYSAMFKEWINEATDESNRPLLQPYFHWVSRNLSTLYILKHRKLWRREHYMGAKQQNSLIKIFHALTQIGIKKDVWKETKN